jgi:hypothetical protein
MGGWMMMMISFDRTIKKCESNKNDSAKRGGANESMRETKIKW